MSAGEMRKAARSRRVQVYMTADDHEQIREAAHEAGLSMPEFLRFAALRAINGDEP